MSHTPGPWMVIGSDYNLEIVAPDGETHVVCVGHDYQDQGQIKAPLATGFGTTDKSQWGADTAKWNQEAFMAEATANAHLIAAAPQMLEVLQAIAADASAYQWHATVTAIIAKAGGQEATR